MARSHGLVRSIVVAGFGLVLALLLQSACTRSKGATPSGACYGEPGGSCTAWSDCGPGTHVVAEGTSATDRVCEACPEGQFSASVNASACEPWRTHCLPGQYVAAEASATADRQCMACQSGSFSTAQDAGSCTAWQTCAAGAFVANAPSSQEDRRCEACQAGTYTTGANQSLCLPLGTCEAGTSMVDPGSLSSPVVCQPCLAGSYCAGGEALPVTCAEGTWDDDGSSATSCIPATDCSPGQVVSAAPTPTTDRVCDPCSGAFSTTVNALACTRWTDCQPGQYVSQAGSRWTDRQCAGCAPGSTSLAENAAGCQPLTHCLPGEHVAGTAGGTNRQCEACASGTFSAVEDAAACTPWQTCAPGTFVANTPSSHEDRRCEPCASGTGTSGANQSVCVPDGACQAGTEPIAGGGCRSCTAGSYCPGGQVSGESCAAGTWDHDGSPATACAPMTACSPGHLVAGAGSATQDRSCSPCASGTWSATFDASSCAAWLECQPGWHVAQAGSNVADRICVPCLVGFYSTTVNAPVCTEWTACPPGGIVTVRGSSTNDRVCIPCPGRVCYGSCMPAGACCEDADCNDGNPCTVDYCFADIPNQTNSCSASSYYDGYRLDGSRVCCGEAPYSGDCCSSADCPSGARCAGTVTPCGSVPISRCASQAGCRTVQVCESWNMWGECEYEPTYCRGIPYVESCGSLSEAACPGTLGCSYRVNACSGHACVWR